MNSHEKDTTPRNYVYFLHNRLTGLTKIGKSYNPLHRKTELESASGMELTGLAVIPTSFARGLERELHNRYAASRVRGEWFALVSPMHAILRVEEPVLVWQEYLKLYAHEYDLARTSYPVSLGGAA